MTKDATHKAIQKGGEQRYFMPTLGRVVMAKTLKEATKIAKEEVSNDIKNNKVK
ncbi:MAG: hypothetical protein KAT71_08035 [Gammaproteobacteria bacterium]|nr:hypothetical protein [Gammaproteobacteria bacterium]